MNEIARFPMLERAERGVPFDRTAEPALRPHHTAGRRRGGWLLGASVILVLAGGLGYGAWRDHTQHQEVAAAAQQQRDFVPDVPVGQVRASGATADVSLPGTTFAYEAANIYARANGYILKRNVDIGDHVKAGDLLAELTAPELDHQISQA
jgi:multidrug efflux pump subunit AcrA (membrane-fusion protein)